MLHMLPRLLLTLLTLSCLIASPAGARNESAEGFPGVAGDDGAPGQPGGDGGPGGPRVVIVRDLGEDNTATATGGPGGAGGNGGEGLPAGTDGGAGGNGGRGGDARAEARVVDANTAIATANGGPAGVAGTGGSATPPGLPGADGVNGGTGDATALATVETSGPDAVRAEATSAPALEDPSVPPRTGNSTSTAQAETAGGGRVDVSASANTFAILPGSFSERTGDASATAFGSNAGTGSVNVSASAETGANAGTGIGLLEEAGSAQADAEGHSTGGGTVDVRARVAVGNAPDRPDAVLVDAVRGSTSGRLLLRQEAFADSGDAITALDASNPGGGDLGVTVWAFGGSGPVQATPGSMDPFAGSDAVLGDILAESSTGSDVEIEVRAAGGAGFLNTAAGLPEPGAGGNVVQRRLDGSGEASRIHGASNGGSVAVSALFGGGAGGGGMNAGDGTAVEMDGSISGDTAGDLSLSQSALGGAGGSGETTGDGGAARSVLSKETASSSVAVGSSAEGGRGGDLFFADDGGSGTGGRAEAEAHAVNSAGQARADTSALGGSGGRLIVSSGIYGRGGDADGLATARTSGDGNAVDATSEVAGGNASWDVLEGLTGGAGGEARSRATGIAEGDSTVRVSALAEGGDGAGDGRRPNVPNATGGDGGFASATALATGVDSSDVSATSAAAGGDGGKILGAPGRGGDAEANAVASGLGEVRAWAAALGGGYAKRVRPRPFFGERGGSATARATASGTTGSARADASTGLDTNRRFRALSESSLGAVPSDVFAQATFGAALPGALPGTRQEGRAFLTGDPLEADVATALADNDALAERFAEAPAEMVALAQWGAANRDSDTLTVMGELDVILRETEAGAIDFGAFGLSSEGDGFALLAFRIESSSDVILDVDFASLDEAVLFFEDRLFTVEDAFGGTSLRLVFEATLGQGDAFGLGFGFVVPEPATGSLLALGLLVLAARRSAIR